MLAVDLFEFLRGCLVILALVHQVQALIVELVRGLIDERVVLGQKLVPERAGAAAAQRDRKRDQCDGEPKPPALSRDAASFARCMPYRHVPNLTSSVRFVRYPPLPG